MRGSHYVHFHIRGIQKQKRFNKDELYFFELHLPVDEEHCEMICKALTPYMENMKNQKLVREGAVEALNARLKFWEGLSKAISH